MSGWGRTNEAGHPVLAPRQGMDSGAGAGAGVGMSFPDSLLATRKNESKHAQESCEVTAMAMAPAWIVMGKWSGGVCVVRKDLREQWSGCEAVGP